MAIAQMNWGRMRYPINHPNMAEFAAALDEVYRIAEAHAGFIWRIPDQDVVAQFLELGIEDTISATVSVWTTIEALQDYTFGSLHGQFFDRKDEWFEQAVGPQLIMWHVQENARPTFKDAFHQFEMLKANGPTKAVIGWPN